MRTRGNLARSTAAAYTSNTATAHNATVANGFRLHAIAAWPCRSATDARVAPHVTHGRPVKARNVQAGHGRCSASQLLIATALATLTESQISS